MAGKFSQQLQRAGKLSNYSRTERRLAVNENESVKNEFETVKKKIADMSPQEYSEYYQSISPRVRSYFPTPDSVMGDYQQSITANLSNFNRQIAVYKKYRDKYQELKNKSSGKKRDRYDIQQEYYAMQLRIAEKEGKTLLNQGYTLGSVVEYIRLRASASKRESEAIMKQRLEKSESRLATYDTSLPARYYELSTDKGTTGYIKQEQKGREYIFKQPKSLLPEGKSPADYSELLVSPSGRISSVPMQEQIYALSTTRTPVTKEETIYNVEDKTITKKEKVVGIKETPWLYGSEGVMSFLNNSKNYDSYVAARSDESYDEAWRKKRFNELFGNISEADARKQYPQIYLQFQDRYGKSVETAKLMIESGEADVPTVENYLSPKQNTFQKLLAIGGFSSLGKEQRNLEFNTIYTQLSNTTLPKLNKPADNQDSFFKSGWFWQQPNRKLGSELDENETPESKYYRARASSIIARRAASDFSTDTIKFFTGAVNVPAGLSASFERRFIPDSTALRETYAIQEERRNKLTTSMDSFMRDANYALSLKDTASGKLSKEKYAKLWNTADISSRQVETIGNLLAIGYGLKAGLIAFAGAAKRYGLARAVSPKFWGQVLRRPGTWGDDVRYLGEVDDTLADSLKLKPERPVPEINTKINVMEEYYTGESLPRTRTKSLEVSGRVNPARRYYAYSVFNPKTVSRDLVIAPGIISGKISPIESYVSRISRANEAYIPFVKGGNIKQAAIPTLVTESTAGGFSQIAYNPSKYNEIIYATKYTPKYRSIFKSGDDYDSVLMELTGQKFSNTPSRIKNQQFTSFELTEYDTIPRRDFNYISTVNKPKISIASPRETYLSYYSRPLAEATVFPDKSFSLRKLEEIGGVSILDSKQIQKAYSPLKIDNAISTDKEIMLDIMFKENADDFFKLNPSVSGYQRRIDVNENLVRLSPRRIIRTKRDMSAGQALREVIGHEFMHAVDSSLDVKKIRTLVDFKRITPGKGYRDLMQRGYRLNEIAAELRANLAEYATRPGFASAVGKSKRFKSFIKTKTGKQWISDYVDLLNLRVTNAEVFPESSVISYTLETTRRKPGTVLLRADNVLSAKTKQLVIFRGKIVTERLQIPRFTKTTIPEIVPPKIASKKTRKIIVDKAVKVNVAGGKREQMLSSQFIERQMGMSTTELQQAIKEASAGAGSALSNVKSYPKPSVALAASEKVAPALSLRSLLGTNIINSLTRDNVRGVTRSTLRPSISTKILSKQIIKQFPLTKQAVRQQSAQKTSTLLKSLVKTTVKAPNIDMPIPKPPKTPAFILPPPPDWEAFSENKRRKVKKTIKRGRSEYRPSFSAALFGDTLSVTAKQFKQLERRVTTGLEERPLLNIIKG